MDRKKIAILGSTGSIGTQTLDVCDAHPELFEVRILTAGSNVELLAKQALKFQPDAVVIADESKYDELENLLRNTDIKVYAGAEALNDIVQLPSVDVVVTALVGFAGLKPTLSAIQARKTIALANKETLVVAGELVIDEAIKHRVSILPIDSEHSAIFQCLMGEQGNEIEKILLTASGGPFRKYSFNELQQVTAADALQHPTWTMGAKITIDSATLMNKGFEMIEARWLFGVNPNDVQVVVHPQSIIHSAVQFKDGSVKAQMGCPDMRLPIQLALTYPCRQTMNAKRLDLFELGHLTFEKPDFEKFPCLAIAYEAARRGGNAPCVINAANEIANLAFRQGRISYPQIYNTINTTLEKVSFESVTSLEACLYYDAEARRIAEEMI